MLLNFWFTVIMNWKGYGGNSLGLFEGSIPAFDWTACRKRWRISVRTFSVLIWIWSWGLLSTSQSVTACVLSDSCISLSLCLWVPEALFLRIKWPEHGGDHTAPTWVHQAYCQCISLPIQWLFYTYLIPKQQIMVMN